VIRLNDGKPWFRRWMWIGYRPITQEGRLLISIGSGLCLIAGISAFLTDGASPWTELAFTVAVSAVIVVTAIAFHKMEERF
jgi:hypothetical protein